MIVSNQYTCHFYVQTCQIWNAIDTTGESTVLKLLTQLAFLGSFSLSFKSLGRWAGDGVDKRSGAWNGVVFKVEAVSGTPATILCPLFSFPGPARGVGVVLALAGRGYMDRSKEASLAG